MKIRKKSKCECGCGGIAKKRFILGHNGFRRDYTPWNKGLTKNTDKKVERMAQKKLGVTKRYYLEQRAYKRNR